MFRTVTRSLIVMLALLVSATASGQGVQTGVLAGTVVDADDLVLPGVTVTVSSSSLQGARTTVTDGNGNYSIRGLPPGSYTVVFELSGMRTVEQTQRVDLGLTARADATLQLATVTETVTVIAELPTLITTPTVSANYRYEEIDKLASPRTIAGIAELSPGLTDNTPNSGQVTIAGGFAYDNQFMVDGVDVADNLFGDPNNLFIEDALEEVQILTSGISAEFGRFGGGVVNAITKSGGNDFSGSLRVNPYKPSWTAETPFDVESDVTREGDINNVYEWTLGGPIVQDRLWFFHAGRRQATGSPETFQQTGLPYERTVENTRAELKLTGTVAPNHTVAGSYLRNKTAQTQPTFGFSIDPSTIVNRELPNDLWIVSYRGVLTDQLFAQVQVSRREFGFRNTGGTSTDILDSPFLTRGFTSGVPSTLHYNAPYFDSTDPEDRNNRQVAGSLSYFVSGERIGTHDIKVGFENFVTTRTGGNSQSSTGYVFQTDYLFEGGEPVIDGDNAPIPTFVPGRSRIQNWLPTRGAQIDVTTNSFFVQDRWAAGSRLTLDLGARFEMVRSEATGDIVGVDTSAIVPRLGATYDVTGDGRFTVQGTYGHYAGKYSETQVADNTDVGSPSLLVYEYAGPTGSGMGFAPAFDLGNYELIGGNFPTANVFFGDEYSSPLTKEFTLAAGTQLGTNGSVKVTYQQRTINNFIEDFINDPTESGKITVVRDGIDFGTFDRVVFENTDVPVRDYQALVLQSNYRMTGNWSANLHWTVQLENDGNFEGEASNQPGNPSIFGDYPEMYTPNYERNNPLGHLDDFQRHKVRAWTTYLFDLSRFGSVDASLLWRFNSARTFSLDASSVPLSAAQIAADPGYATPPTSQTLFFDERGSERFEPSHQFDIAVGYELPIFRALRPWAKFEVYNVFNDQSLVEFNTAITPDEAGPTDALGLPTTFVRGSNFGTATANTHFPRATNTPGGDAVYARTFLMSFGLRF